MFGKKQEYVKELEEKLSAADAQIEILQSRIKRMEEKSCQMPPHFKSQITAQSDMMKEMARVEGAARDAAEACSESGQACEQFAIEFTSMRRQMEEEEQKKKKLRELFGRQKKQLEAIADEKKHLTGPAGNIRQVQEEISECMQEMQEYLRQMQEFSKQMSTLSLSCAIEAGRLGESGKQFIGAADDVRKFSNSYGHAAQTLSQTLEEMEGRFQKAAGQVGSLEEALKKDGRAILQLSKIHSEAENLCGQVTACKYSEKVYALTAILKKISQNHEIIASLQRQSINGVQMMGASLREEQEARKEMEYIFTQIGQDASSLEKAFEGNGSADKDADKA